MTVVATKVLFDDKSFTVVLQDGRELRVPLNWFPRLAKATAGQRNNVRISSGGFGLHWDELDETLAPLAYWPAEGMRLTSSYPPRRPCLGR